ncbi:MAG: SAM-dependent chlorinase/fluorinase [Anaerolineae bacterium]|nr:SAM-dependent chlorinase/fluorinase [Anaerolineae bacterium]
MTTIITLTSDFGLRDGYVGTMKGVILSMAPHARLVDLTHEIEPQNIRQAIFVLAHAAPYFPPATIHVAVVDPGVGTARRPLLVTTPRARYIGPDNGIFTAALDEEGAQAWALDQPAYWLPRLSRTFHGRDLFAPVAAHLANGVPPERLGRPVDDPVRLAWPQPLRHADGHLTGEVIYVDRFGNLISNIPAAWLAGRRWQCEIAGHVAPVVATYGEGAVAALIGLVGSSDTVEVAVRNGNAAQRLGVGTGETVVLWPIT